MLWIGLIKKTIVIYAKTKKVMEDNFVKNVLILAVKDVYLLIINIIYAQIIITQLGN